MSSPSNTPTRSVLADLLAEKKKAPEAAAGIVEETTEWLCREIDASGEDYQCFRCRSHYFAYSRITLQRDLHGIFAALEIKISEIVGEPVFFADVRLIGNSYRPMLPIQGSLTESSGKERLLHYIADFVLGVESGQIEQNPRFVENPNSATGPA